MQGGFYMSNINQNDIYKDKHNLELNNFKPKKHKITDINKIIKNKNKQEESTSRSSLY